jgi:PST family polysaccharide transporter
MMFPIQNINVPMSQVMLPILGRLREEPERFRRAFLMATQAVQLAAVPGMAVAVASSDILVPFLLGDRWSAASPIFFWLGLAALTQPLANSTGWLFIASGRTGAMLRWGLTGSVTTLLSFVIGLKWGPVGVAVACFVGAVCRQPILYHLSTKGTAVRKGDLYMLQLLSLLGAAAAYAITRLLMQHLSIVPMLCAAIPSAYLFALLSQGVTKAGRDLFVAIFRHLRPPAISKSPDTTT